jgi:hypothetical protein
VQQQIAYAVRSDIIAARAADVDNSSREQPEWRFFRGCRVLREIVDARERGMLGFHGMRGEHALRRFSHQHVPRYCPEYDPFVMSTLE